KVNSLVLFLIKIILSILIIICTYGYKDIKYFINNLLYFYVTSILLGGFLYYLNLEFSYKNIGLIFYHKELSINYYFIIIFGPLILYLYVHQAKKLRNNYSLKYNVDIYLDDKTYKLRGYLDTANNMIEPYKRRMVIVTNSKELTKASINNRSLLVPYDTIDGHGLLKCIVPNKVIIESIGAFNNIVVGITSKEFNIEGINCILNANLVKGIK
ncbi:MAG: sigma-E processing peptidase SpoIIGA, partial [Bacilli bacterium]